MTDRTQRLFEIIQILRAAEGPLTARELAAALEVTKRTIYRDIVTLQATGVPIEGEAGVGYLMRSGYDLPPLMFSAEEVEAIVVGLSLLGRTGDAGLQTAAAHVSQKIAAVLPEGRADSFETKPFEVSSWTAVPPTEVSHQLLRTAIREEEKLCIGYRDAVLRETHRTVQPIALVYYVESTVLAAWCELRGDFRHFRVDRMTACAAAGSFFHNQGNGLRAHWRSAHGLRIS